MLLFLVNFIRVSLFILIVYFVIKFIAKLFTPKAQNQSDQKQRKDGETTIHQNKTEKKKKFDKNDGEYVDYDEIK